VLEGLTDGVLVSALQELMVAFASGQIKIRLELKAKRAIVKKYLEYLSISLIVDIIGVK
jgi:hypothetical protein